MIKKGRGMALTMHTTGAKGNGDPDQSHIRLKLDGSFDLTIVTEEMGQGARTVFPQIAAEALDVSVEKITVRNSDTDSGGFGFVTGGSRSTFITGNAILNAVKDLKKQMLKIASGLLETPVDSLVFKDGKVGKAEDDSASVEYSAIAEAGSFGGTEYLMGCGNYMYLPPQPIDIDTGECNAVASISYAAGVVEIEVDTETGIIDVKKLYSAFDVGRALNPTLVEGQVFGGDSFGLGMALMEDMTPAYPDIDFQPIGFHDYIIPTAVDMPESSVSIIENPDPDGPFGAKGIGEITVNWQPPAITNAVYDAIGVWIDSHPITPEKVLRALEEKAEG